MATKQDQILECVFDIKKDIGEINGHLKQLNGNVSRNIKDIGKNRDSIDGLDKKTDDIKLTLAKWGGGVTVLIIVAQVALKFIVK